MAYLIITTARGGTDIHPITQKLTSIGRGKGNSVSLEDDTLAPTHAHILFDGSDFILSTLDVKNTITVNGKKGEKFVLSHDDSILLGKTMARFSLLGHLHREMSLPPSSAYKRFHEFSARLSSVYSLEEILTSFTDLIIELIGADKGFLIVFKEPGVTVVEAARNMKKEDLVEPLKEMSDTILRMALTGRRSVLVTDTLKDKELGKSSSVIALKLRSAMCVPLIVRGSLLGALYVGSERATRLFEPDDLEILTLFSSQACLVIQNALAMKELDEDRTRLKNELEEIHLGDIVGSSEVLKDVFDKMRRIASSDITVLLLGETGTGKELIARDIHRNSLRKDGPLIAVNCGAIPDTLLESELFGFAKGAFTGAAYEKNGLFKAADGGTIFLDEVTEMSPGLQVKLLRVLQDREFMRIGEVIPQKINVRVIAATNKVLDDEVKNKRFREDLFYRLNVFPIVLPPLRDRGEDILILARYFLEKYSREMGRKPADITQEASVALMKYHWPGNIRELENRIQRALVMAGDAQGSLIDADDLDIPIGEGGPVTLAAARDEFMKKYILEALARNNGDKIRTTKELGISMRTLYRYL